MLIADDQADIFLHFFDYLAHSIYVSTIYKLVLFWRKQPSSTFATSTKIPPFNSLEIYGALFWAIKPVPYMLTYIYCDWLPLGIALTDLHCFRTLRLKIRDTDIMYWNGNFNFKVIRCLWKKLQQKIHFWHFINIFVLEAMFQIFISDSWNVVGNFHQ